jgi:hypothetical protein
VTTAETEADGEKERLTALGGLAALSLDALSSVAYGPEAILLVLVAAGTAGLKYSLPITGAIVVLARHWYSERANGSTGRSRLYLARVDGIGTVLRFADSTGTRR